MIHRRVGFCSALMCGSIIDKTYISGCVNGAFDKVKSVVKLALDIV